MGIAVCETEKAELYPIFFFSNASFAQPTFEKAWPFDTRFVYSSVPAITAFRAVTFQLLNRFWFAYFTFILAMYTSTYVRICENSFSAFCSSGPIIRTLSSGFNF